MNFKNLPAQESKEVWSLGRIVSRVMSEMQFGGLCRGSWQWWCLLLVCMMAIPASATLEEGSILYNWKGKVRNGGELTNWTGSADPCARNSSWFRVSCNTDGFVQQIDLGNLNLSGLLVPELGQLSELQFLSVYNNSFNGGIPQELGNLTALVFLDLSANQFSGPIPASFSKLTNLKNLKLSSNKFSGSFPVSISQLYQLSKLVLDSNSITGVVNVTRIHQIIDATATIYAVQSLGVVSLMNNNITDVAYQPDDVLNNRTLFKLQGNPYCAISADLYESYDDGRRCFCQQNCSITSNGLSGLEEASYPGFNFMNGTSGTILWNWKNQLGSSDHLTNWADQSDPCGSNPWFYVFCNSAGHVQRIDLGSSDLSGPLAPELGQIADLEILTLYNNSLNGSIPQELGNLSALNFLDLSSNQLLGLIPDSFEELTSLTLLKLSYNNLTGSFPEFLLKLRNTAIQLDSNSITGVINLTRIRDANLSFSTVSLTNNLITDVVHQQVDILQSNGIFRLLGNPYCAGSNKSYDDGRRCFCQGICAITSTSAKNSQRLAIIIGTVSGAVFLVLAIVFGVIFKILAKRKLRNLEVEYRHKFAEFEVNPQPFLYNELRLATQDFNESTKLGNGSFGTVYKGVLSNGNEVAIKRLKPRTAAHSVEVDDFLNEVVFITKMKHRNLVDLKGYCMRGKNQMLVYEYVENMDVEQSLLMGKNKEAMNWPVRFNICLGVAQGLHYLHTYAQPRVIHRDIKASNILLDSNYAPKIADFGLALLFPDEKTHISTATVAGTRGYLAPEYASYGELSEKADIYSFGVLCLEIISSRKNIDQAKPPNQVYLPSWAWKLYEEKNLKNLIDPSLHLNVDEVKQALRVINTALCCLQQIPDRRPSMSYVQTILQGDMEPDEIVFPTVNSSILEDSILFEDSALVSGPPAESILSKGR